MHIMSAKESGMSLRIRKFRLESNGTVIFRKIRSEIKDYLRDSPFFPFSKERRELLNFQFQVSLAKSNYEKSNVNVKLALGSLLILEKNPYHY